ncbi:glutamine amidotransferase [Paenibacillus sabinae]|nr:glutamine amidotransferase [Paenibacillus sabinae]
MKVLFLGESWVIHMIHTKGYDSFTSTKYEEGATFLLECIRNADIEVDYMPGHEVQVRFPNKLDVLKKYDVIVISDVGANTFLLPNQTFYQMEIAPNSLELIRQYVEEGGGLLMIGGYLSFTGIEAKANYKNSPLAEVLPVELSDFDDRVETPQGFRPEVVQSHSVVDGLGSWPTFLGYNRLTTKPDAEELVSYGQDPFLVVGQYKKGKTAAFASDCAPHWGSLEFMNWEHYQQLWVNILNYLKP